MAPMRSAVVVAALLTISLGAAHAQNFPSFPVTPIFPGQLSNVDPGIDFINFFRCPSRAAPNCGISGPIVTGGNVSVGDLLQAASGPTSKALVEINAQLAGLRNDYGRLAEGVALSSALTTLPPNAGDRFFISVSGASYDGRAAAAVNASVRLGDNALGFAGYARSANENLFKGGLGFSFK
jgi:hypothetical protein